VLPTALVRTPTPHRPLVLVAATTLAGLSVVSVVVGARGGPRVRAWLGPALAALAGAGLLWLVHAALPAEPEHGLALAAAVAATVAPVGRAWLRLPVQILIVGGMAVLLVRAGRDPADTALWVFLLAFVVWLCGAFSRDLLAVRRSAREARRSAERRAELLAAVGDLSGRGADDAAATVASTVRSLGFTVAGVSLRHGDLVVPLALEGLEPASGLRVGEGVTGAAIAENRTIVVADYENDPLWHPHGEGLRSVVGVPVRERGEAVGVVVGGRDVGGRPPEAMIEILDVLAAHLGGVLETERRIVRQRELLTRMQSLEDMRSRLLSEISEHVRDPLTVVRGIAQTLVSHGDSLSPTQRDRMLEGFELQTRALRETIDALLDFSRFQAEHPVATHGLVRVGDLLRETLRTAELVDTVRLTGELDALARTDPELLARAVGLTLAVGGVDQIRVRTTDDAVVVRFEGLSTSTASRSRLLLRLAQRLLLALDAGWEARTRHVEMRVPRSVVDRDVASEVRP
jgi:putative methionine-R-sulfoxide reductase with GAF domain